MAYKILCGVLAALFVVAGLFYVAERYKNSKAATEYNNQIATLEGTIKDTETAYSQRGIELEGLKAKTEELQKVIEDREEEIVALGQISIEWKNKYLKIKNAKQSYVNPDGSAIDTTTSDDPSDMGDSDVMSCDVNKTRIKVEFEQEEDPLIVKGFTLTNPAYAEISLEWTRKLNLDIVLAKDADGHFRLYVDPGSSDAVPMELDLKIDPSVLDRKWYENIGFGADIAGGNGGVQIAVRAHYDILNNFYIGPMFVLAINESLQPRMFGGISVGYYPWRKDQ
jgi:hypothetical protein